MFLEKLRWGIFRVVLCFVLFFLHGGVVQGADILSADAIESSVESALKTVDGIGEDGMTAEMKTAIKNMAQDMIDNLPDSVKGLNGVTNDSLATKLVDQFKTKFGDAATAEAKAIALASALSDASGRLSMGFDAMKNMINGLADTVLSADVKAAALTALKESYADMGMKIIGKGSAIRAVFEEAGTVSGQLKIIEKDLANSVGLRSQLSKFNGLGSLTGNGLDVFQDASKGFSEADSKITALQTKITENSQNLTGEALSNANKPLEKEIAAWQSVKDNMSSTMRKSSELIKNQEAFASAQKDVQAAQKAIANQGSSKLQNMMKNVNAELAKGGVVDFSKLQGYDTLEAEDKALLTTLQDAQGKLSSAYDEMINVQKEINVLKKAIVKIRDENGLTFSQRTWKFIKEAVLFSYQPILMVGLFSAPNYIQQAIQEHEQRLAALETVAGPLQFGNWVVQLDPNALDNDYPFQSAPLYELIPVNTLGDPLPADPNNVFYGTLNAGTGYKRWKNYANNEVLCYQTDTGYYQFAPIIMSYPTESYNKIGQTLITDPSFSGQLVDLNSGYAMDAANNKLAISPPIIDMKANTPINALSNNAAVRSVAAQAPGILAKLKSAGKSTTYQPYGGIASGANLDAGLLQLFSMDKYGNATNIANKNKSSYITTLVSHALDDYAKSYDFGVWSGTSVTPLFGWGNTYYSQTLLPAFPHFAQALSSGGTIILSQGAPGKVPAATPVFATALDLQSTISNLDDPKNNAATVISAAQKDGTWNPEAQGCWVYTCQNTPFAQSLLKSQLSSADKAITDYVIFFDEQWNHVPFKIATQQSWSGLVGASENQIDATDNVFKPQVAVNPDAVNMVSLVSYDMPQFQSYDANSGAYSSVAYLLDDTSKRASVASTPIGATLQAAIETIVNGGTNNYVGYTSSFPALMSQVSMHKQALRDAFYYGPFPVNGGKLTLSPLSLVDSAGTMAIAVYEGRLCHGSKVPDLLIAVNFANDGSGNYSVQQLPAIGDPLLSGGYAVNGFISLVTDIQYTATYNADTSYTLSVATPLADVGYGALGGIGSVNASNNFQLNPPPQDYNTLTTLPGLYSNYTTGSSAVTFKGSCYTSPTQTTIETLKLNIQATANRIAWIQAGLANLNQGYSDDQATLGNYTFTLSSEFDYADATTAGMFVYDVTPSPSAALVAKDWFVLTSHKNPLNASGMWTLLDAGVAAFNANLITPPKGYLPPQSMISLVTGLVYDMDGNPVLTASLANQAITVANYLNFTPYQQALATSVANVTADLNKAIAGLTEADGTTSLTIADAVTNAAAYDPTNSNATEPQYYTQVLNYNMAVANQTMFSNFTNTSGTGAYDKAVAGYGNSVLAVGSFGSNNIALGMYSGDFALGAYVYFDVTGYTPASASTFTPTDYFIAYQSTNAYTGDKPVDLNPANPEDTVYDLGIELGPDTSGLLSLVSGWQYDLAGNPIAQAPMSIVQTWIQAHNTDWRPALSTAITAAQKAYQAKPAPEQPIKPVPSATSSDILWAQTDVQNIIAALQPAFAQLDAPYATLMYYDPTQVVGVANPGSAQYVHVAPGSLTNEAELTYTFYNVPTSDKKVKGALYGPDGTLAYVLSDPMRTMAMNQWGIYEGSYSKAGTFTPGTAGGAQVLSPAPSMVPALQGIPAGFNPKAGETVSGKDIAGNTCAMIVNTDLNFPGGSQTPINLPSGNYVYYSTHMNNYYLWDNVGLQFIDLSGGHVYHGVTSTTTSSSPSFSPKAYEFPVATRTDVASPTEYLLLETGGSSSIMGDPFNSKGAAVPSNNAYCSWSHGAWTLNTAKTSQTGTWTPNDLNGTTASVVETFATATTNTTTYAVTLTSSSTVPLTSSKTYTVDGSHTWQPLIYVPSYTSASPYTDTNTNAPGEINLRFIRNSTGAVTHVIYNQALYSASFTPIANAPPASYTCTQVSGAGSPLTFTLDVNTDSASGLPYFTINGNNYCYLYQNQNVTPVAQQANKTMIQNQLQDTLYENGLGAITTCPISIANQTFNPKTKQQNLVKTYTLLVPNISTSLLIAQTIKDVSNVPTDPASIASAAYQQFSSIMSAGRVFQTGDGRFVASLYPQYTGSGTSQTENAASKGPFISYITPTGTNCWYVDLFTGALFNNSGLALGNSLTLDDLAMVCATLHVGVAPAMYTPADPNTTPPTPAVYIPNATLVYNPDVLGNATSLTPPTT